MLPPILFGVDILRLLPDWSNMLVNSVSPQNQERSRSLISCQGKRREISLETLTDVSLNPREMKRMHFLSAAEPEMYVTESLQ